MNVSIPDIISERSKTHGHYPDVACSAQRIKEAFKDSRNWYRLNPAHREALEMMAMKLARILNGNPAEPDHWQDIAGYASLAKDYGGELAIKDKAERGWLESWRADQREKAG